MGTPLPPIPDIPGELCGVCWGDGKPFGNVTPSVISIALYELEEGSLWVDDFKDELFTPTLLFQNATLSCFYANVTEHFNWVWNVQEDFSIFSVKNIISPSRFAFAAQPFVKCVLNTPNELTSSFGRIAFNGKASVSLGG